MRKTWLVTGSNRGLGLATVQAALDAGNCVMATARDPAPLESLQAQHPERLRLSSLDVTQPQAANEAAAATIEAFGGIDVLVNNAGYGRLESFETTSEVSFRDQIEVNSHGAINLVRAVLFSMRARRSGHIINIASVGSRVTTPGLAAYQAAKWALTGFTEVLAKEVSAFGVKAIALELGGTLAGGEPLGRFLR